MKQWLIAFVLFIPFLLTAQDGRKITRDEYIDTYKDIAMREMEKTNIPASITLAQGILESGNGNSTLARKANNHFGIKCHDWKGKSVKHDDDAKSECFRKYKSVDESYNDHSEFLTTRSRYAFLFEYESDNYEDWAKGLKKAGYATSPTYSKALIQLIEDNELYKYDQEVIARMDSKRKGKTDFESTEYAGGRQVQYENRVKYILAREGDSFNSLSEELDLLGWQLPKYNDLPAGHIFSEGEVVYLQPKRSKAETGKNQHVVVEGENLQSISQHYAIQLDKLAKRNNIDPESQLERGSIILLRGKKKGPKVKTAASPKIIITEQEPTKEDEFQVEFDLDN